MGGREVTPGFLQRFAHHALYHALIGLTVPGGLIDESILSELHEMAQSDGAGMVRELIDLFLENAPPRIAQIQQSTDDPAKLSFHAHALKSMSLNLGCKLVVEKGEVTIVGHGGSDPGVSTLVSHHRRASTTIVVLCNYDRGSWAATQHIENALGLADPRT